MALILDRRALGPGITALLSFNDIHSRKDCMTKKIWIVDNTRLFAEAAALTLSESKEYATTAYHNCHQAMADMGNGRGVPDVILLSDHFPRVQGTDCLQAFRSISPGVIVVILTDDANDPIVRRCLWAGANGYVVRRSGMRSILEALNTTDQGLIFSDPRAEGRLLETLLHGVPFGEAQRLTSDEEHVLALLAEGQSPTQIARILNFHVGDVTSHASSILEKMRVSSVTEAVAKGMQRGIIKNRGGEM